MQPRLRLLVACYHTRIVGGAEAYLQSIIPRLCQRGIEIGVLTRSADLPGEGGVIPADVPWLSGVGQSPAELVRTVADWNPSVVYTHGLGEPEFEAALARRFPTVFYAHNYGGMCISGTKYHAFPGVQPCSRSFGPGCLALYFPRRCGGLHPVTALRSYGRERQRQRALQSCRSVLVASQHMAKEMVSNGVPVNSVHLVPLPATAVPDTSPPQSRPASGRVLFVGRLTAMKGWAHLLDAVPRASTTLGQKLTLVIAGDGPDRNQCEAFARQKGIAIEFLGWVNSERLQGEMRAADVIVVPSIWPEPFGLIGIEAGCVGTPAVAYDVGGISDWLIPGVSGELAPGARPNPADLAAAIVRVLADPEHHQRLRVGAWETARRFTPEAHLDRLIPILEAAAR